MRFTFLVFIIVCILALFTPNAIALDHMNLDEGRPIHLQDAYSVAKGEFVLETGAGVSLKKTASDQGLFSIQFVYGILPNTHFELGTTFFTSPHHSDSPHRSGDVNIGALYNFNQETLTLPALAVKGSLQFPSGVDSSGVDSELTWIVTKSFHRLTLSFNAGYQFLGGPDRNERRGRYKFVLGGGYPVGAPMHTRMVLLSDVYLEQSAQRGEKKTIGSEIGLRYQLRERIVVDFALGSEFSGPSDRSRFFLNAGFSVAF